MVSPHDGPKIARRRFELQPAIRNASASVPARTCGLDITLGQPPRPRKWARLREDAMFQMIDQSSAGADDRKMLLYKVGMFIVAISAVGGVIFLCMRSLS